MSSRVPREYRRPHLEDCRAVGKCMVHGVRCMVSAARCTPHVAYCTFSWFCGICCMLSAACCTLHVLWAMLHLEDGRAVGQVRQRVGHLARELELRDPCQVAAARRCRAEPRVVSGRPGVPGTQCAGIHVRFAVRASSGARQQECRKARWRLVGGGGGACQCKGLDWWWRSSPGVVEQARHHRNI